MKRVRFTVLGEPHVAPVQHTIEDWFQWPFTWSKSDQWEPHGPTEYNHSGPSYSVPLNVSGRAQIYDGIHGFCSNSLHIDVSYPSDVEDSDLKSVRNMSEQDDGVKEHCEPASDDDTEQTSSSSPTRSVSSQDISNSNPALHTTTICGDQNNTHHTTTTSSTNSHNSTTTNTTNSHNINITNNYHQQHSSKPRKSRWSITTFVYNVVHIIQPVVWYPFSYHPGYFHDPSSWIPNYWNWASPAWTYHHWPWYGWQ
ncbi:hypothetical protein L218DRAFT_1006329 [Marasmius fiardii PR-910]|nr:hypothetical protein L218DRAFT_1006329 [Marasmius fiardii PR-910]